MELVLALCIVVIVLVIVFRALGSGMSSNNSAITTNAQSSPGSPGVLGMDWKRFEKQALEHFEKGRSADWSWAETEINTMLGIVPGDGDSGNSEMENSMVLPIEARMLPSLLSMLYEYNTDIDRMLERQALLQSQGLYTPISILVTLYPVRKEVLDYARAKGRVSVETAGGVRQYPKVQVISVQEILRRGRLPLIPPVETITSARPSMRRTAQEMQWEEFERKALDNESANRGWAWAEEEIASILGAVSNEIKTGDGGIDARYHGEIDVQSNKPITVPIQIKMQRRTVGRPVADSLLGVQASMQNQGQHAPMSLLVTLYPVSKALREYAQRQGEVFLTTKSDGPKSYPKLQLISVKEMLQEGKRPVLPPKSQ